MKKKKAVEEQINHITDMLKELDEDSTVPKNVKLKLQKVTGSLKEEKEAPIKINAALSELDEIADDSNLQPYTRTQIWNIVSILEKIK